MSAQFERWAGEFPGCGDHSCVIRKPKGMGTNGGCRCRPAILRVVMGRMKRELENTEREFEEYRDDAKEHYGPYGPVCMNTGQFDAGECWLCYMKRKRKELKVFRRKVDNIKIRAYELGQKELHDMACEALQ